jgi:transmembrane sensor
VITLADGSVVSLNTESALKVDLSSSRRAITLLKGEAFFRVAHDPSRPFEVLARKATVKAVGTQFNVRMAPQATVVSVLDGTVEIREPAPMGASPGAASAMRVRKGEETQIPLPDRRAERTLIARTTTRAAQRAAAWTQGRVDFDATPLIDVIAEFQRYQIVSVQIDDRASQELKLTGSFDVHDPDSALAYVATIPGMVVEKQGEHAFRIRHTP